MESITGWSTYHKYGYYPQKAQPDIPSLPMYTTTSDTYARDLYHHVLGDSEVDLFLRDTKQYDASRRRWSLPSSSEELLDAVFSIFQSVLGRFIKSKSPDVERRVLSTKGTPGCDEENEDGYRACPLLVVLAAGPSFGIPELGDDPVPPEDLPFTVGFTNMASYIIARKEEELGDDEDILRESASYSRSFFAEQPNRLYVRSLVITERHARLVHIDRAGAQITPPIDIHQEPATLVRVVAGLSSTNERLLGLDDSVQWNVVSGKKRRGTLTTTSPSGKPKTYEIVKAIPILGDTVLGRGTTCWRVRDPETLEEYVVKDAWRPDCFVPEHELLELVKGVPGVVQMVAHETGRGEIQDFRCPTTRGQYKNRIASRTTMKAYGKSIACFTSTLQVLYALRDAIAGHQRLGGDNIRILHRDISHNNVLLGKEGAPIGERGILIDLDMAFRATDSHPTVLTNHNIGTRIFQSISVMGSARLKEKSYPHDHIEELESFFYLMTYIFLLFKPDGSRVASDDEGPPMIRALGVDDPAEAEENKMQFRRFGHQGVRSGFLIRQSWGAACGVLFETFLLWIMERTEDKDDIFCERPCGANPPSDAISSQEFYSRRDEHYAAVLQMFDDAIDLVKVSTTPSDEVTPAPPPSTAPLVDASIPPPAGCPEAADDARPPVAAPAAIGPSPTPSRLPSNAFGEAETTGPTTCVGVTFPLPHTLPPPTAAPAPLRRSARIQKIHLQQNHQPLVPATKPSRLINIQALTPSLTTAVEPRRSARIQKRCLDQEEHGEVPQPKVRRTKRGPRSTTRAR